MLAILANAKSPDDNLIQCLIRGGARVNVSDNYGTTPLIFAIESCSHRMHDVNFQKAEKIVKLVANAGADVNKPQADFSHPKWPLMLALKNDKLGDDVIKCILSARANVNIQDKDGTPLLLAIQHGRSDDVIKAILECKADVNVRDHHGNTALLLALKKCRSYDVIVAIIEALADKHDKDSEGNTPLLLAIKSGNDVRTVNLLLDYAEDVNVADNRGKTPLMAALQEGFSGDVIERLIEAKADVNR